MDHHCTFIGRCIGKGNMKYFMQYCVYTSLLLFYAEIKLFQFIYTVNIERNEGVMGLTWLFPPTPFHALYIFWYPLDQGGFHILRTIDNFLVIQVLFIACFTMYMAFMVFNNVRRKTSEVDKLKPGKFTRVFVEPRTTKEIIEIIFGKNPTFIDFILPTPIKLI